MVVYVLTVEGNSLDILYFQSYQSGFSQVKYRIIKYLGSLGGSVNYNLLANAQDEITKQAISWDSQKHLKFDMPFMDMKPTIYLGEFHLPPFTHVIKITVYIL